MLSLLICQANTQTAQTSLASWSKQRKQLNRAIAMGAFQPLVICDDLVERQLKVSSLSSYKAWAQLI